MKKCKKCLEEKELIYFDQISINGYRGTCRKCRNAKYTKKWLENPDNIIKRREYNREYSKNSYNNLSEYKRYNKILSSLKTKLNINSKCDINHKNYIKNKKEFIELFEKKFDENMNWNNYGTYWEIDHIVSALKMIRLGYSDEEINDIENVRPLTIKENRSRYKKEKNDF